MRELDILAFANKVNEVDDQLGTIADYEGESYGPTYEAWHSGAEHWQQHCDVAIELHQRAIKLWRQGKRRMPVAPQ